MCRYVPRRRGALVGGAAAAWRGSGRAPRTLLNRKPVARRAEGPCSREGRSRFGSFARMREKPAPEGRIGRGKQRRRSPSRCRAKSLCIRGNAGGGEDAGAGRALSRLLRSGLSGLRLCRGAGLVRGDALSVAAHGLRFESELAVLSGRLVLSARLMMRFWRGDSLDARRALRRFAVGSRLSFFLCQEKRDGLRDVAFLFRRVEIATRAFSRRSSVICLCGFTSGLCVSLWRSRWVTGERGTGERGWRRGLCALLRGRIGFAMLSAGSTLGLNVEAALRPLWTLFMGLVEWLSALYAVFALGSRLSFFLCQEKRDGLRYLAFLFRRVEIAFARSRGALRLSAFVGSLRVCAFLAGDPDGVAGDARNERTGLAARLLCAFAQSHWL